MPYQVLGYERKTGDYEGRPYDNIRFYFMEDAPLISSAYVGGNRVLVETASFNNFHDRLPIVGSVVNIFYNKFGKVDFLQPYEVGKNEKNI